MMMLPQVYSGNTNPEAVAYYSLVMLQKGVGGGGGSRGGHFNTLAQVGSGLRLQSLAVGTTMPSTLLLNWAPAASPCFPSGCLLRPHFRLLLLLLQAMVLVQVRDTLTKYGVGQVGGCSQWPAGQFASQQCKPPT